LRVVDFNRGIYALAWTAFRAKYAGFAAIALFLAFSDPALKLMGSEGNLLAANLVISSIISFVAHWTLLNNGRELDRLAIRRLGGWAWIKFTWWSFLLTLPSILALIVLTAGQHSAILALLTGMLAFVAAYAVTLALWGTVLPQIAATGRASLAEAGRRGARTFRATLRDLAAGPAAFTIGLAVAITALSAFGVPIAALLPVDGGVSWIGTLVSVALVLGAVYGNALFAAVLCKAYHRGGGLAA
jgi:hypothetical protein